jgi:hypothetical protein
MADQALLGAPLQQSVYCACIDDKEIIMASAATEKTGPFGIGPAGFDALTKSLPNTGGP